MLFLLAQLLSIYAISWAAWRFMRRFVVKDALDNIPGPPSESLFKGNFRQIFNHKAWGFHRQIAEKYGGIVRIKALLGENWLYVYDPKALHHIVVKDQYVFEESTQFIVGNRLFFGDGLLSTLGDRHRKQRKMLNPVFSIAHMRQMVPIFWDVSSKLRDVFVLKVKNEPQEIDVTHWMTRVALELIGQSGFGYSFDPLTEDGVAHPYSAAAKELITVSFPFQFLRTYLLPTMSKIGTPRFQRWVVDVLPWPTLHRLRDIIDIIHNTSVEIFESKKRALAEGEESVSKQVAQGKDIMSILLKANMEAVEEDRLSDKELLGQMSTLTFAAMDTTSGALSRIVHLLSTHPNVQEKLREEIVDARKQHGENLAYDELVALPYLDAVCRETLRLYPPVSQLRRTAREDIILPFSSPIKGVDGREMTEVLVPKDTNVMISIIASNCNPEIWGPDSYEWKPERWLLPLPDSVPGSHIPGIYSHLMTFLGGGRACIGFKFSQLEMKVVLATLVGSFKFSPSDKEIFWQMTNIATPVVAGGDPFHPSLPMKVTAV